MTDKHHPVTSAMLPNEALAAAIAAAAEIARNGGDTSLLFGNSVQPNTNDGDGENRPSRTFLAPTQMLSVAGSPIPSQTAESTHSDMFSHLPIAPNNNNNNNNNVGERGMTSGVASAPRAYAAIAPQPDDNDVVDEREDDSDDSSTNDDGNGNDNDRRIARSRERNREHARRTRLRKKAQLEALQCKVQALQAESKVLQQKLEECHIASILVGLSSNTQDTLIQELITKASECQEKGVVQLVGKRKRFVVTNGDGTDMEESNNGDSKTQSQPLQIRINGKLTRIGGGRTHINWKSGVYSDEHGTQRKLTREQLESLRRERNRMHAKMTRDRKKNFIATIEKTIDELESNNASMREVVSQIGTGSAPPPQRQLQSENRTPSAPAAVVAAAPPSMSSPSLSSVVSHDDGPPTLSLDHRVLSLKSTTPVMTTQQRQHDTSPIPTKRVRHGFTLGPY